jgi:D-alanine--poly(phosphoribitol) ligase subunit 1
MEYTDTLYAQFAAHAAAAPCDIAVKEQERELTYSELDRLADTIARRFPGKPHAVGIVMDHGAEMIAAMLAVLKVGAAYIPAEPSFPPERIRYMMAESGTDFVLTREEYVPCIPGTKPLTLEHGIEVSGKCSLPDKSTPDDTAYVLYTSGTTGTPKGIAVANRNVCHYARAFAEEFHTGPGDVMLQYSVCTFDIFVEEVWATLLNGATLAIPSRDAHDDLPRLMAFSENVGVTQISGFPYFISDINQLDSIPPSIRLIISGGDVLRSYQVDRLVREIAVYNTYGPSETTVCASYFCCNGAQPLADGTYPIGRPVSGATIALCNEHMQAVALGEVGEIIIGGAGVSKGYLAGKDPGAFTQDAAGKRIYRSGDLGYLLPDGNLAFVRRKDTQIMIEGRRTEPAEVQTVLTNCQGVDEALVRAYADEHGLSYLIAYVVPGKRPLVLSSIREEMLQYVPAFMIPEFFVIMDSFPLTPNGKPDDAALPIVMKEG